MFIASSFRVLIVSFKFTQKVFVPQGDDGNLQASPKGPEGCSLESSTKVVKEAEKILANYKYILGYLMVIGAGGRNNVFGFIPLKNWGERSRSYETIGSMLNKQFSIIPSMSICAMDPCSMVSGNASSPIEFTIKTNLEYDDLYLNITKIY